MSETRLSSTPSKRKTISKTLCENIYTSFLNAISLIMKKAVSIIKEAVDEFGRDRAVLYAAALSFYAFFSLAPLILIAVSIAGALFGEAAVRGELMGRLSEVMSEEAAVVLQDMLADMQGRPEAGVFGALGGFFLLLVGASALFFQLQKSLNQIWYVRSRTRGLWGTIKKRAVSFAMVVGIGVLLLVLLILQAVIAGGLVHILELLPAAQVLIYLLNLLLYIGAITVLFAVIFKVLPDHNLRWDEVWRGSFFTAVLFMIGMYLAGFYLGREGGRSIYGASASVIVLLLWIYYASQVFFLGAELTKVDTRYARKKKKPGE